MLHLSGVICRWIFGWVYYIALICFLGAMVGVFSHLVFALLVVEKPDYGYYASLGFIHGLHYSGVWAGGASIVICVIRARREFLSNQSDTRIEEVKNKEKVVPFENSGLTQKKPHKPKHPTDGKDEADFRSRG